MKLFKHKRLFIIILIALLLLFAAKAYYDTNSIEIRHYAIKNSSLGRLLSGLKVAHLSDLHLKKIDVRENRILEILKEEKPDLILVSGDLVSFEGPYEPVLSFFHQLKVPLGIYAVLGNTEYSNENGSCILCHEERSKSLKRNQHPIFLRNSFSQLKVNGRTLNILGVDDPVDKRSNLRKSLKGINSEEPSILLAHSPEIFKEASELGIDLLLCGHTHGGQIFLTRYLRKIFPLEASLEFIDGFFQKAKTLMYVNRGIGTSYLPFRFGVKPEITFFKFTNDTNEKIRMSRIDSTDPINSKNSINSSYPTNTSNPINPLLISTNPSKTIFTGLSLSNLIETFNVLNVFDSLRLTATQQHGSTAIQKILFDFESELDLERLNWECHKWFELSEEHATSGRYSFKVVLPAGQYPGINFREIRSDWSEFRYFKMDVFNPANVKINFHIRIDDNQSGVEYANRFDTNFELKQGLNQISIPVDSIRTNIHHQPLNLKQIKRMIVFLMNNTKSRELYIDNIRLE